MAAERGVRVYTVGIGTPDGEIDRLRRLVDARAPRRGDAEADRRTSPRGEYFYAGTAADLKKVYQSLNSQLVLEKKETEITALFAAWRGFHDARRRRPVAALVQPDSVAPPSSASPAQSFWRCPRSIACARCSRISSPLGSESPFSRAVASASSTSFSPSSIENCAGS